MYEEKGHPKKNDGAVKSFNNDESNPRKPTGTYGLPNLGAQVPAAAIQQGTASSAEITHQDPSHQLRQIWASHRPSFWRWSRNHGVNRLVENQFPGRLPSFDPSSPGPKGKRQTNWFRGHWTKPPFSGPCTTSLLVRYPYLDDRRRTATRLGLVCVSVQLQEISQG